METTLAAAPLSSATIEQVLLGGDLSKLTPQQRLAYYNGVCESLGLNPLTKPFSYINLNGKLTLYALKDCTEQLRTLHSVSVQIKARELVDGVYVVTATATKGARVDESIGAVPVEGLKGDAKANAMMKAETKSKRRVTLSICGLGMLDETEIETVKGASHHVEEFVQETRKAAPFPKEGLRTPAEAERELHAWDRADDIGRQEVREGDAVSTARVQAVRVGADAGSSKRGTLSVTAPEASTKPTAPQAQATTKPGAMTPNTLAAIKALVKKHQLTKTDMQGHIYTRFDVKNSTELLEKQALELLDDMNAMDRGELEMYFSEAGTMGFRPAPAKEVM